LKISTLKTVIFLVICLTALLMLSGCADILEDATYFESPHQIAVDERPPDEVIQVSNYTQLEEAIFEFVAQYMDTVRLRIYSYDGNIDSDIDKLCFELQHYDPIGSYAISDITYSMQTIVSYIEIELKIEYEREKSQIDSIITVSTQRFLMTELLSALSNYQDEALFRTTLRTITSDEIMNLVKVVYYQNPRTVVMLPVMAVDTFPNSGDDRIYELVFRNYEPPSILRQYSTTLAEYVRRNAESAGGDTDAEILLSLAKNLIGACVYDEGVAKTISEHGAQNLAVTAYGALINGSAVGEGFAMAFKALCDELGFNCSVVLGYLDGMVHAWNIVAIYGEYYHIDISMCAFNGIETMFLKTDADIEELYSWDKENTVRCTGELTYEVVAKIDELLSDEEEGISQADDNNPDDNSADDYSEDDSQDVETTGSAEESLEAGTLSET